MKRKLAVVVSGILLLLALAFLPFFPRYRQPDMAPSPPPVPPPATRNPALLPSPLPVSPTGTSFVPPSPTTLPTPTPLQRTLSWHTLPDAETLLGMAAIVEGEAAPEWDEGYSLVAWTLRLWAWNGRLLLLPDGTCCAGWHGKKPPSERARRILMDIWQSPMGAAPYPYCYHLGNDSDATYWQREGWYDRPADLRVVSPYGTALNCYTSKETRP